MTAMTPQFRTVSCNDACSPKCMIISAVVHCCGSGWYDRNTEFWYIVIHMTLISDCSSGAILKIPQTNKKNNLDHFKIPGFISYGTLYCTKYIWIDLHWKQSLSSDNINQDCETVASMEFLGFLIEGMFLLLLWWNMQLGINTVLLMLCVTPCATVSPDVQ